MNKYFWFSNYRLSLALAGPATTAFVVLMLTPFEMGIYYVFSQLLLFTLSFELSCGILITQSMGKIVRGSNYEGNTITLDIEDRGYFQKIESFSRTLSKIIPILSFLISWPIGYYVLESTSNSYYQFHWFLFVTFMSIGLLIQIYTSKLEGYGNVALAQKIRLFSQIIRVLFLWIALVLGLKIYSLVISSLFAFISYFFVYKFYIQKINHNFLDGNTLDSVDIKSKINHQILITFSNLFGNFIMRNLLVVVVFYNIGAEIAGPIGLSIVLLEHIFIASLIPIQANLAKISRDTSLGQNKKNLLQKSFISLILFIIGASAIFLLFNYLYTQEIFKDKIIDPNLFLLLSMTYLPRFIIEPIQTYLRALSIEPFWFPNILVGTITIIYLFFYLKPFMIFDFVLNLIFLNIALLIASALFFIIKGYRKKF